MHCNDPNCQGNDESITAPDMAGRIHRQTSLRLDSVGNPVVSYFQFSDDFSDGDLKVLHCNDPNCQGDDESITVPDTNGFVGRFSSLALDEDGNPVVSYLDEINHDLKLLHCDQPTCIPNPASFDQLIYLPLIKRNAVGP
jgi:hypothetical protein